MTDVFENGEATPEAEAPAPAEATADASVNELLQQLLSAQREHRAEVNALRQEISKNRAPSNNGPAILKTDDQLREERFADIRQHSHYCPGCGALSPFVKECTGKSEAGHPPILMVSTEELLSEDPTQHTPAPATVS
jgi:hypothetical protein